MFIIKEKFLPVSRKSFLRCGHRIASHRLISHHNTALQALPSPFGKGKNSPFLSVLSSKCQSYSIGYMRQLPLCGEEISHLHSPPRKDHTVPKNRRKDNEVAFEFYRSCSQRDLEKMVQLRPWRRQRDPAWLGWKPSCKLPHRPQMFKHPPQGNG